MDGKSILSSLVINNETFDCEYDGEAGVTKELDLKQWSRLMAVRKVSSLITMNPVLKNRGKNREDIEERRKAVEEYTQVKLASIASYTIDPLSANKNIENMIGTTQIPLGYAGPI
jgi:hydroxymethylglutaryl-CoA reductase